jgi:hypothetical protein
MFARPSLIASVALAGLLAFPATSVQASPTRTADTSGIASGIAARVDASYLVANLDGSKEVPAADPDGQARAVIRVQGNQLCFSLNWKNLATLQMGHIHFGAAGANGPVQIGLFDSALPSSLNAVAGCVTADAAATTDLLARPSRYYVNLHTGEFPSGAVRGQLRRLTTAEDIFAPFRTANLTARLNGTNEVPGPGDPDGNAIGIIRINQSDLHFGFLWGGIASPTAAHLHAGGVTESGPVAVPLFASAGIPSSIWAVAGTVTVATDISTRVSRQPSKFYLNVHNAEFPDGAIRGQLARVA